MARERVTQVRRPAGRRPSRLLRRMDAPLARELFIRHALVHGSGRRPSTAPVPGDQQAAARGPRLSTGLPARHRRRRGHAVRLHDQRVPAEVVSGAHFDSWWKQERTAARSPSTRRCSPATRLTRSARPPTPSSGGRSRVPRRAHVLTATTSSPGADDGPRSTSPSHAPEPGRGRRLLLDRPGLREELVTSLIRGAPAEEPEG